MDEFGNLDNEVERFMDEPDRYLDLPDPETLPDEYFEGMPWEHIKAELDRIQRDADEYNYMREYWEMWEGAYGDAGWQNP